MGHFTAKEKRIEAMRELGFRLYVYPRRVMAGKLTQQQADRQIALMKEIAEDYTVLAEAEDAKGRLL